MDSTVKRRSRLANQAKSREAVRIAKDVPCADCGRRYSYYVMQFDHVRGEKIFNIGASTAAGYHKILAEIAKCEVVCANCHAERGHQRRSRLLSSVD